MDDKTDMTRGVYRRLYAGFVGGKRINRLSLEAEAWFWRVHAAADDHGNLAGDPSLLYTATAGRRAGQVSIDRVVAWVDEMVDVALIQRYEVAGECYLHIVDFELMQPGGKNGRRVHRVPGSLWDVGGNGTDVGQGADPTDDGRQSGDPVNPGESKKIQESSKPSAPHHYHHHNHHQDPPPPPGERGGGENAASGEAAAAPPSPAPAPKRRVVEPINESADPVVMTFPCDGAPKSWALRQSQVNRFRELFPALDPLAECRSALAHAEASPAKRKTAGGMLRFLTAWLQRSQNNPRMRASPQAAAVENHVKTARQTKLEEALNEPG